MIQITNKLLVMTIGVLMSVGFVPPLHAVTGCVGDVSCTLDETSFTIDQAPQVGDLFTLQLTLPVDRSFGLVNIKPSYNTLYPLLMLVGDFGIPVNPLDSNTWSDVITFDALAGDPPLLVSKLTLYSLDSTTLPLSVQNLIDTLANPINSAQQNIVITDENSNGIARFVFPSDQVHGGVLLDLTLISPEEMVVPEPATWAILGTLLLSAGLLKRRIEHVNQGSAKAQSSQPSSSDGLKT